MDVKAALNFQWRGILAYFIRNVNAHITGPRAKDNDNDKKFALLSSADPQALIAQGIITWLDFVVSFPTAAIDVIEETRFVLSPGMLRLLRNKIVHIDELKPMSYLFIKEINTQLPSVANKFYEALDKKYIKAQMWMHFVCLIGVQNS